MGGCPCTEWWERPGGAKANTCDAKRRGGSAHLGVETVLDASEKPRGNVPPSPAQAQQGVWLLVSAAGNICLK